MVPGIKGLGGFDRLGVRLVFLLGIALLPIGLIATIQTNRSMNDARARMDASLLGDSLAASANQRRQITRTMGVAEAISVIVPRLLGDPGACVTFMEHIVAQDDNIIFAGFTDLTGTLSCASEGSGRVLSDPATMLDLVSAKGAVATINNQTEITRTSAVLIRQPVRVDGTAIGLVTLTLPYRTVNLKEQMQLPVEPLDVLTFDTLGTVLASDAGLQKVEDRLPATRKLADLAIPGGLVFEDEDRQGRPRIYSVVPVVPGQIFALGVWPTTALRIGVRGYVGALAFPVLMWLASLAVAYFAVHRLVIRHIRALRRNIRTFGAVRRIRTPENLRDIPVELREVVEAFTILTEKVLRDEADQENLLHEKDVLLKEVHHRVKNNLQLIASITNMQIRRARHAETKFMLRRLQDRVMGLATVHRNLYQASVLSEVRADELVADLARQLSRSSTLPDVPVDFDLHTEPVLLYPDQAVPLSLLVTEAITNAYKYLGRPETGTPWVSLSLSPLGVSEVELRVRNSTGAAIAEQDAHDVSGLGSQLIGAFVMQLGGSHAAGPTEDGAHEVRVTFTRADFSATDEPDTPHPTPAAQ